MFGASSKYSTENCISIFVLVYIYPHFLIAANYCKNLDKDGTWILPDRYELSSLYMNQNVAQMYGGDYWTRNTYTHPNGLTNWHIIFNAANAHGRQGNIAPNSQLNLRCVRATAMK